LQNEAEAAAAAEEDEEDEEYAGSESEEAGSGSDSEEYSEASEAEEEEEDGDASADELSSGEESGKDWDELEAEAAKGKFCIYFGLSAFLTSWNCQPIDKRPLKKSRRALECRPSALLNGSEVVVEPKGCAVNCFTFDLCTIVNVFSGFILKFDFNPWICLFTTELFIICQLAGLKFLLSVSTGLVETLMYFLITKCLSNEFSCLKTSKKRPLVGSSYFFVGFKQGNS
jgi:hypothetical protein